MVRSVPSLPLLPSVPVQAFWWSAGCLYFIPPPSSTPLPSSDGHTHPSFLPSSLRGVRPVPEEEEGTLRANYLPFSTASTASAKNKGRAMARLPAAQRYGANFIYIPLNITTTRGAAWPPRIHPGGRPQSPLEPVNNISSAQQSSTFTGIKVLCRAGG